MENGLFLYIDVAIPGVSYIIFVSEFILVPDIDPGTSGISIEFDELNETPLLPLPE